MQVFISYRRSADGYLALAVRSGLEGCNPAAQIFLDTLSIAGGTDFERSIGRHLAQADIVLVLVGPGWTPDRLHDPADYVRFELLEAARLNKRVVPVLHSGTTSISSKDLPDDLAWLAQRQSISFGLPSDLESDVQRLDAFSTVPTPALRDLQAHALSLYGNRAEEELDQLAEEAWADHSDSPSGALADICRLAAVSLIRSRRPGTTGDLWMARALTTAFRSGDPNTFAACLLPPFFRLSGAGRHGEARSVLDEIERLMDQERMDLHPVIMQRRIVHEKRGFSYWGEHRFAEALFSYELAKEASVDDERGLLKIRGAIALCRFSLGDETWATEETEEVATRAEAHRFLDVEEAARANLVAFRERTPHVAYEVT